MSFSRIWRMLCRSRNLSSGSKRLSENIPSRLARTRRLRFILHGSLRIKVGYSTQIKEEWKKPYNLVQETISELQAEGRISKHLEPSWDGPFVAGHDYLDHILV